MLSPQAQTNQPNKRTRSKPKPPDMESGDWKQLEVTKSTLVFYRFNDAHHVPQFHARVRRHVRILQNLVQQGYCV